MTNYKLIALDIDGTLLNSEHYITDSTKVAISQAVKKGVLVVISTGRAIQAVESIISELDLDLPFITYNGAMIVMGSSKEILYEQNLSKDDAISIYDLGERFGTTIIVWNNNKLYVNKFNKRSLDYGLAANSEPILIENIKDIVHDGATKLLWYDDVETIQHYEEIIGAKLSDTINFHTSKPFYLEFVDKQASKALALERLGNKLNIEQHEMIAVGDGFNDLSMIKYAGLGVAMENASSVIKDVADYVTHSNDDDGVSHVINKFILSK